MATKMTMEEKIAKWAVSKNYKDRFKAEYHQLKIRRDKLVDLLERMKNGPVEDEPISSYSLLMQQRRAMSWYLNVLEKRAEVEGIKL